MIIITLWRINTIRQMHCWSHNAGRQTDRRWGSCRCSFKRIQTAAVFGISALYRWTRCEHSVFPLLRCRCLLRETSTAAETTGKDYRHQSTQLHLETQRPYCNTRSIGLPQFYTLFLNDSEIQNQTQIFTLSSGYNTVQMYVLPHYARYVFCTNFKNNKIHTPGYTVLHDA
jgi:hypothetical protein